MLVKVLIQLPAPTSISKGETVELTATGGSTYSWTNPGGCRYVSKQCSEIYDQAGRILFSKSNYTNEWDGTLEGSPLAEGTYYYIVDFGAGKPKLKGFITIVRD